MDVLSQWYVQAQQTSAHCTAFSTDIRVLPQDLLFFGTMLERVKNGIQRPDILTSVDGYSSECRRKMTSSSGRSAASSKSYGSTMYPRPLNGFPPQQPRTPIPRAQLDVGRWSHWFQCVTWQRRLRHAGLQLCCILPTYLICILIYAAMCGRMWTGAEWSPCKFVTTSILIWNIHKGCIVWLVLNERVSLHCQRLWRQVQPHFIVVWDISPNTVADSQWANKIIVV